MKSKESNFSFAFTVNDEKNLQGHLIKILSSNWGSYLSRGHHSADVLTKHCLVQVTRT